MSRFCNRDYGSEDRAYKRFEWIQGCKAWDLKEFICLHNFEFLEVKILYSRAEIVGNFCDLLGISFNIYEAYVKLNV